MRLPESVLVFLQRLCSLTSAFRSGHRDLLLKGVLHRDVSDSNIVLIYDPVSEKLSFALLIDWDLSKEKKEIDERRSFDDNRLVRSPCHTFP